MSPDSLQSTATLIRRIQGGEESARERLVEHCLPALRSWARGRLPFYGRDLSETDDLVQVTLMRALKNVERFEPERQGAFLAYLRQILLNTVRDEIRRTQRAAGKVSLDQADLEAAGIGAGNMPDLATLDAYDAALAKLPQAQSQAMVLRIEFGMTFPEIAAELEMPSANAARMQVSRGLTRLAQAMSA